MILVITHITDSTKFNKNRKIVSYLAAAHFMQILLLYFQAKNSFIPQLMPQFRLLLEWKYLKEQQVLEALEWEG